MVKPQTKQPNMKSLLSHRSPAARRSEPPGIPDQEPPGVVGLATPLQVRHEPGSALGLPTLVIYGTPVSSAHLLAAGAAVMFFGIRGLMLATMLLCESCCWFFVDTTA